MRGGLGSTAVVLGLVTTACTGTVTPPPSQEQAPVSRAAALTPRPYEFAAPPSATAEPPRCRGAAEVVLQPEMTEVGRVEFAADGHVLAVSDALHLWSVTPAAAVAEVAGSDGVFAADGSLLVVRGGQIERLQWPSRARLAVYRPASALEARLASVLAGPRGEVVALYGDEGPLWAGDQETPRCRLLPPPDGHLGALRWAAGGDALIGCVTQGETAALVRWDASDCQRHVLFGFAGGCPVLDVAPAGDQAALGQADGGVQIWDLERGEALRGIPAGAGPVTAIAYAPDGRSLAVARGEPAELGVWDPETATRRLRLDAPGLRSGRSLAFSRDGSLLALGTGSPGGLGLEGCSRCTDEPKPLRVELHVFRLREPGLVAALGRREEHLTIGELAPNGRSYELQDKVLQHTLRRVDTGAELARGDVIPSLGAGVFAPAGDLMLVPGDMSLRDIQRWNTRTGARLPVLQPQRGVVHMSFSGDGTRLLTDEGEGLYELWDLRAGRRLRTITTSARPDAGQPAPPRLSHDGRRALLDSARGIEVWATDTGKKLTSLDGSTFQAAFNGAAIVVRSDHGLNVYDANGEMLRYLSRGSQVALDADGTRLASVDGGAVEVSELATMEVTHRLELGALDELAFETGDRLRLRSGSVGYAWDLASGVLTRDPIPAGVTRVRLGSGRILTRSGGGLQLWSGDGALIATRLHTYGDRTLTWTPEGAIDGAEGDLVAFVEEMARCVQPRREQVAGLWRKLFAERDR